MGSVCMAIRSYLRLRSGIYLVRVMCTYLCVFVENAVRRNPLVYRALKTRKRLLDLVIAPGGKVSLD